MEECVCGDLLFADERLGTARSCFTVPQSYSMTCPISEAMEHVLLHDPDCCHYKNFRRKTKNLDKSKRNLANQVVHQGVMPECLV